jgi:hypothetical protein
MTWIYSCALIIEPVPWISWRKSQWPPVVQRTKMFGNLAEAPPWTAIADYWKLRLRTNTVAKVAELQLAEYCGYVANSETPKVALYCDWFNHKFKVWLFQFGKIIENLMYWISKLGTYPTQLGEDDRLVSLQYIVFEPVPTGVHAVFIFQRQYKY